MPKQVYWGCTMGAQIRKQKNNGQEKKERKNKKNEKRQHSIQRECVRKKTWALSFYIYMYVCVCIDLERK